MNNTDRDSPSPDFEDPEDEYDASKRRVNFSQEKKSISDLNSVNDRASDKLSNVPSLSYLFAGNTVKVRQDFYSSNPVNMNRILAEVN